MFEPVDANEEKRENKFIIFTYEWYSRNINVICFFFFEWEENSKNQE